MMVLWQKEETESRLVSGRVLSRLQVSSTLICLSCPDSGTNQNILFVSARSQSPFSLWQTVLPAHIHPACPALPILPPTPNPLPNSHFHFPDFRPCHLMKAKCFPSQLVERKPHMFGIVADNVSLCSLGSNREMAVPDSSRGTRAKGRVTELRPRTGDHKGGSTPARKCIGECGRRGMLEQRCCDQHQ